MNKERIVFNKFLYNGLSDEKKLTIDLEARKREIAFTIKSIRQVENKWSAQTLAKKAQVSAKTISKIENSKSVELDSFIKIIEALGGRIEINLPRINI